MQTSYFAVLELEPRFALDTEQIERAYRALAARVHPDRHATAPANEQRQAMALAADANEAYRTLKKPAPRATHLLRLRGVEALAPSSAVPPAFLLEQMELREAIASAKSARDTNALNELQNTTRARFNDVIARLTTQLDVDHDNAAAARTVQELLFFEKLTADIDDAHALLES